MVKFLLKHKADMLAANRDNVTPLDLLMAKVYTNDYSVLVGLFRTAALELEEERLQLLYDTRREGPTDKRRWNHVDKATSFQQTSKRDLLRFSRLKQGEQAIADTFGADQSHRSTMVVLNGREVGLTSKAAKKRRDAQELAQERHPVLKVIEDRERLAELQRKFHRTRTVGTRRLGRIFCSYHRASKNDLGSISTPVRLHLHLPQYTRSLCMVCMSYIAPALSGACCCRKLTDGPMI